MLEVESIVGSEKSEFTKLRKLFHDKRLSRGVLESHEKVLGFLEKLKKRGLSDDDLDKYGLYHMILLAVTP